MYVLMYVAHYNMTSPRNTVRMTAGADWWSLLCTLIYNLAPENSQDDGRCRLMYVLMYVVHYTMKLPSSIVGMTAGDNWCTC
jgi:hypothetical protein